MRLPLLLLVPLASACTPDPSKESASLDTGDTASPGYDWTNLREAVLEDLDASYATGAQVAIWKGGGIVFAEGFGSRHPDRDEAIDATTLFQIGSDTKKLAAVALLRQVDEGRLALDTPLSEAIPDLTFALGPTWTGDCTLHHLMSHASGFFDYTPWTDAPEDSFLAENATGRFAENEYRMAPPGEFWNYSNPNFSLVGLAAEEADGRWWADIVEQDIFAPLGLTRTMARQSEVEADGDYATGWGLSFADGYDSFDPLGDSDLAYDVGTVETVDQPDNAFTRPAGLVWSTASDMVRFAAFLMDGDPAVLSDGSLELIHTANFPLYPQAPAYGAYGYGLMVSDGFSLYDGWHDEPLWSHGGNTMTMTSAFYVLPDQGAAISILSNGYGDDFTATLVAAIQAVATLGAPTEPPDFPPAGDLSVYVGHYTDPYAIGDVLLTYDGTALHVEMPAMDAMGITYDDTVQVPLDDYLVFTVEGYEYAFMAVDASDGTENAYLVNRQFVATRVPEGAPPSPIPPEGARRVRSSHLLPAGTSLAAPVLPDGTRLPSPLGGPTVARPR